MKKYILLLLLVLIHCSKNGEHLSDQKVTQLNIEIKEFQPTNGVSFVFDIGKDPFGVSEIITNSGKKNIYYSFNGSNRAKPKIKLTYDKRWNKYEVTTVSPINNGVVFPLIAPAVGSSSTTITQFGGPEPSEKLCYNSTVTGQQTGFVRSDKRDPLRHFLLCLYPTKPIKIKVIVDFGGSNDNEYIKGVKNYFKLVYKQPALHIVDTNLVDKPIGEKAWTFPDDWNTLKNASIESNEEDVDFYIVLVRHSDDPNVVHKNGKFIVIPHNTNSNSNETLSPNRYGRLSMFYLGQQGFLLSNDNKRTDNIMYPAGDSLDIRLEFDQWEKLHENFL